MKGFKTNIEKDTIENKNFRKVLYTGNGLQLVVMSLKAGEEIGKKHIKMLTSSSVLRRERGNAWWMVMNIESTMAILFWCPPVQSIM
jgi:hypothetical protein